MGLVLSMQMDVGHSALCHLPHLLAFHCRVRAVSTLVTPCARCTGHLLHSMALAPISNGNLAKLESLFLGSVWRATWLSRAKETVSSVLAPGHKISSSMHMCYEGIIWRARVA